jgi:NAD(P)H-hydrate repair Nnr-like enzyme with NAD(P)H-hydrate epimerase domain
MQRTTASIIHHPCNTTNTNTMDNLPILLGDQARNMDLEVTEKLGRVRVLECVATRIADTIHYHLGITPYTTPLLFVAGKGNNGANALAAARILAFRGWSNITVVPLVQTQTQIQPTNNDDDSKSNLRPNIAEQFQLLSDFGHADKIHPLDWERIQKFQEGVIIDGILGTGIASPPRGVALQAIQAIIAASTLSSVSKSNKVQVLAIDIPSGLNHVTGEAPGECIRATWTINLHMLKSGQLEPQAKPYIGELWSAETALGFTSFPGEMLEKFTSFYKDGPIQKVVQL